MDSMLKPIFCLGVGIMTAAAVGTGGIILVINTRVLLAVGGAATNSAMLAAFSIEHAFDIFGLFFCNPLGSPVPGLT